MKIGGRTLTKPSIVSVVIPREGEEPIVFKCQAVIDYSDFDALCPMPKPPVISEPGKEPRMDVEDLDFKAKVLKYFQLKTHWLFITSLRATPDLEWETVKYSEPDSWLGAEAELRKNFVEAEVDLILDGVKSANALDDAKLKAARDSFLASQAKESPKQ